MNSTDTDEAENMAIDNSTYGSAPVRTRRAKKVDVKHLVWKHTPEHHYLCENCGYTVRFNDVLPCPIDDFIEFSEDFRRLHQDCKPGKKIYVSRPFSEEPK